MAPTQDVPIIAERLDEGSIERHPLVAHWGLVPSWAKDMKIGEWLDPDLTDKNDIQDLLDSLPEPTLTPRIVTTQVNSGHNGPEFIQPAE